MNDLSNLSRNMTVNLRFLNDVGDEDEVLKYSLCLWDIMYPRRPRSGIRSELRSPEISRCSAPRLSP
jgi:hypothetical protein